MIPVEPLMTIQVEDTAVGLAGFVVIHTLGESGAGGGIRCAPDITLEEVKRLAHAMTCKYTFFGLRYGGGKGGLIMDDDVPTQKRKEIIRHMGRHLRLVLQTGAYSAWTDMNFGPADMAALYEGAAVSTGWDPPRPSARRTALSTFAAVVSMAESLGLAPRDCRVSIEGFGAVGGALAEEIVAWGGRVVAVSNVFGAVYHPQGLPVAELLACRGKVGPQFILHPGSWRNAPREHLFEVEADILVPCARVGSVTGRIAQSLRVQAVVPAANVPCTEEAERTLAVRRIPLLPDFVVNAGGVLGMMDGAEGRSFFLGEFKQMIDRLIRSALADSMPPIAVARETANEKYASRKETFFERPTVAQRILDAMRARGLFPDNRPRRLRQARQRVRDLVRKSYSA